MSNLRYNIVMKLNLIKIEFDSETVKLLSERVNLLSWAVGGLNYIGFELQGISKVVTIVIGWLVLQYFSFVLLKVSRTIKMEETQHGIN